MNHSSFIQALAQKLNATPEETQERLDAVVAAFTANLKQGNQINISSFGLFNVALKEDQIIVDPTTHKRMLVPPRLEVTFQDSRSR